MPPEDRAWLLGRLEAARAEHGLDLIAIDYVPPGRRDAARAVRRAHRQSRHRALGRRPPSSIASASARSTSCRVERCCCCSTAAVNGRQANAEVHRLLATPLEYLGLVPVYHDLATLGLPAVEPRRALRRRRSLGARARRVHRTARVARGADGRGRADGVVRHAVDRAGIDARHPGGPRDGTPCSMRTVPGCASVTRRSGSRSRRRVASRISGDRRGARAASNTVHLGLEDAAGRVADLVVTGPWGRARRATRRDRERSRRDRPLDRRPLRVLPARVLAARRSHAGRHERERQAALVRPHRRRRAAVLVGAARPTARCRGDPRADSRSLARTATRSRSSRRR